MPRIWHSSRIRAPTAPLWRTKQNGRHKTRLMCLRTWRGRGMIQRMQGLTSHLLETYPNIQRLRVRQMRLTSHLNRRDRCNLRSILRLRIVPKRKRKCVSSCKTINSDHIPVSAHALIRCYFAEIITFQYIDSPDVV
jgi:hypothetical protein